MTTPTTNRRGMSLLELVIASAMLALVLSTVAVTLRGSRQAWEAHEADFVRLEELHATVRHLVRQARQAIDVAAISAADDASGRLSLKMPDGSVLAWDHEGTVVRFGVATADQLLANHITSLRLVGYKADGVTPTTTPDEIQNLYIEATTTLPRDADAVKTASSWVWLRTW